MTTHTLNTANSKERKTYRQERSNPLQKVIRLINQYWSIDQMYGTPEEKTWAKQRLEDQINGIIRHLGKDVHGTLKASLKSKAVWETTREYLG